MAWVWLGTQNEPHTLWCTSIRKHTLCPPFLAADAFGRRVKSSLGLYNTCGGKEVGNSPHPDGISCSPLHPPFYHPSHAGEVFLIKQNLTIGTDLRIPLETARSPAFLAVQTND